MFYRIKRRIAVHRDNELLKSAVINNLVPEDKREILFSTQLADELEGEEDYDILQSETNVLKERIDKLEIIVKKLVEYLLKNPVGSEQ